MFLHAMACTHIQNLINVMLFIYMASWLGWWAWDPGILSSNPPLAVELIPGGVDSARHSSEVGIMSASLLVSCVGVVTCPGLCPMAKETA